ncbi:Hsp70 family protein [Dactylosporangium sp. NPDC005572]|uniref:Hsp70 family protein n=1 Tax=Dactylosporangium sp. NPDC005572 TaxID=3156889 RepID=UPI0033B6EC52
MPSGGAVVRLGIDVGSGSITAVLQTGRTMAPVLVDGAAHLDTAVFIETGTAGRVGRRLACGAGVWQRAVERPQQLVERPADRLTSGVIEVAGVRLDPVDLVAEPLRRIAAEAARAAGRAPDEVVVAVPARWGPRRRAKLRVALHHAGLGQPRLVETPVAVGAYLQAGGVRLPVDACLAVCDLGVGFEASVLRRTRDGFEVLACVDVDAGGAAIDTALATHLTNLAAPHITDPPQDPPPELPPDKPVAEPPIGLVHRARTAKEALATSPTVLVPTGGLAPAVLVDLDMLRRAAAPVLDRAVTATRQAIAAADIPAEQLRPVCITGGGAWLPLLGDRLRDEFGITPQRVADPQLAAACGALHTTPDIPPPTNPAGPVGNGDTSAAARPSTLDAVQDVTGILASAGVSVGLLAQFLTNADRYGQRQSIDPGRLMAHWGGLATAAVLGAIAAVTFIVLATASRHAGGAGSTNSVAAAGDDQRLRHRLLGAALAAGGAAGVGVAAVYATIAAGFFELPAGPFLRWAVLPVLPMAASLLLFGAAIIRRPEPPPGSWLPVLRFPVWAVLLLGAGTALIGKDIQGGPPHSLDLFVGLLNTWAPPKPNDIIGPTGRLGAALLGAGMGLLVVRRWWTRIFVVPLLAGFAFATLAWRTADLLAIGVAIAVAGWWLWRPLTIVLRPMFLGPPPTDRSTDSPPAADAGAQAGQQPASGPQPAAASATATTTKHVIITEDGDLVEPR